MQPDDACRVLERLDAEGVDAWVDGGWGVDALLGRATREHDDLDLVAELGNAGRLVDVLRELGYEHVEGAPPRSFMLIDAVGRQIDVHPVSFDEDGGGVYQMEGDRVWVYPAEGFDGRGSIAGRRVRCLSPDVQVLVHAGYELTEKDYRELHLLHERFGVELPAEVREQVNASREVG
jgi:lincosamide nucleotidyltransferase A/C/D/E